MSCRGAGCRKLQGTTPMLGATTRAAQAQASEGPERCTTHAAAGACDRKPNCCPETGDCVYVCGRTRVVSPGTPPVMRRKACLPERHAVSVCDSPQRDNLCPFEKRCMRRPRTALPSAAALCGARAVRADQINPKNQSDVAAVAPLRGTHRNGCRSGGRAGGTLCGNLCACLLRSAPFVVLWRLVLMIVPCMSYRRL